MAASRSVVLYDFCRNAERQVNDTLYGWARLRIKDNQVFFESDNYTGAKFGPMVLTRATKNNKRVSRDDQFFFI